MNQLRELSEAFALQLHGNSLLAPAARRWLNFMKIAIIVMVAIEGSAWGYGAGWLLGDGALSQWFWGMTIGVIVATLLWGLDAQFITIDLDKHQKNAKRSSTNRKEQDTDVQSTREKIWQFLKWPGLPVGGRVLIILVSFYVTAPFIALYELRNEIDHDIEARFKQAVESRHDILKKAVNRPSKDAEPEQVRVAREALEQSNRDLIAAREVLRKAKEKYDNDKNNERQNQIDNAGREAATIPPISQAGLRQAYINVEAAKKVNEEKSKIHANLFATQTTDDNKARTDLDEFEKRINKKDFRWLKDTYGIPEPPNTLTTRLGVLNEWRDKDEFKQVTHITYILLGVVAGVIFLGKYYQPDPVRAYLSEQWQTHWKEYQRGVYDELLDDIYKSDHAEDITPTAFCDLWGAQIEPYKNNKKLIQKEQEIKTHVELHRPQLDRKKLLEEAISQTKVGIDEKEEAKQQLEKTISGLTAEIEKLRKKKGNVIAVSQFSDSDDPESTRQTLSNIEAEIQTKKQSFEEAQESINTIEKYLATHCAHLNNFVAANSSLEKQLEPFHTTWERLKREAIVLAGEISLLYNKEVSENSDGVISASLASPIPPPAEEWSTKKAR